SRDKLNWSYWLDWLKTNGLNDNNELNDRNEVIIIVSKQKTEVGRGQNDCETGKRSVGETEKRQVTSKKDIKPLV
ncbi:hypothetical protein KAU34_05275, partial [candidate division WOR-3 bacterium]|nr:hypothetical protein [candidate division WOR-3 bacterium]